MEAYYKEILAFLGFVLAVYLYIIKFKEANKKSTELKVAKEENLELKKKFQSSSMNIDLADLNGMREVVDRLFNDTVMDRFLLLSGVNGKTAFNFVSALYEQHKNTQGAKLSIGATSKFVNIETDGHYKSMLLDSEKNGHVIGLVKDMPSGTLKDIYIEEEVKAYGVFFIQRQKLDDNNDRLVYISFATHEDGKITNMTKIKMESASNRIKALLQ